MFKLCTVFTGISVEHLQTSKARVFSGVVTTVHVILHKNTRIYLFYVYLANNVQLSTVVNSGKELCTICRNRC